MNRRIALVSLIVCGISPLFLVGCDKDEPVTSYAAPKEPQLIRWTLPDAWQKASYNHKLQYAAFTAGEGDEAPKITVSYLFANASGARDLLQNVNRWRRQLSLEPVPASELTKLVTASDQNGATAQTVDLSAASGQRMRASIVPREDRIWFYKMTGPAAAVESQKETFDAFVKSVQYPTAAGAPLTAGAEIAADQPAPPHPTAPMPTAPAAGGDELAYTLPAGWTREPNANRMRVATLSTGGEKPAQLIVTRLSGNFGGMMLNLNRWRGEVGLPPAASDAELKETPVKVGSIEGSMIDLAGPGKDGATPMRSRVARCSQGDSVWFFKILGPAETVTTQQAAFEAFLASVRLPGEQTK